MDRPYVVCHMLASVDGKIDGAYAERSPADRGWQCLASVFNKGIIGSFMEKEKRYDEQLYSREARSQVDMLACTIEHQ